ncbi:hypothetical protein [Ruminococcus albus]|uniref:hypothetical protein n=1 Tax=Ruminococcus albus TaxID=1264 RepID=UPI0004658EA6|nr:hypothetical protein [Ruminococcus albus]
MISAYRIKTPAETEIAGEDTDDANDNKSMAEIDSLEEECDFCVYDDIRDKLIARGIPADEIAYIHDAKNEKQKSELFEKVRNGDIRILLGSTAKMGTGTNVQKKADRCPRYRHTVASGGSAATRRTYYQTGQRKQECSDISGTLPRVRLMRTVFRLLKTSSGLSVRS